MARQLKNVVIDRVDLVDKGANQRASIVLAKRAIKKDSPNPSDVHVDTIEQKRKKEKDLQNSKLDKFMNGMRELFKSSGLAGEEKTVLTKNHADILKSQHVELGKMIDSYGTETRPDDHPIHSLKAQHEALGKMLEGCVIETPQEPEMKNDTELAKKLSEIETKNTEIAKQNVELAKKNEELTKRFEAERGTRLDGEMETILKSFKATPFNTDKSKEDNDVRKFRKMQDADPDGFARTMQILKAQDEIAAASPLFKNDGSSRSGGSSATAALDAKAAELQKNDTSLTKDAAFAKACLDNPALARQSRAEIPVH